MSGLAKAFDQVFDLQPEWTRANTPAMKKRGLIINKVIPSILESMRLDIAEAMGIPSERLKIDSSDGVGGKTVTPWIRFSDSLYSPKASIGRYCVFLFDAFGDAVYLSLNLGVTVWEGKYYTRLPDKELKLYADWGYSVVNGIIVDAVRDDFLTQIDLKLENPRSTGRAYESANSVALRYSKNGNISDLGIKRDIIFFSKMLKEIYAEVEIGSDPLEMPQEVLETIELSGGDKNKRACQGFRLNQKQKKAIEEYAMQRARIHLENEGWHNIQDTSSNKPYDFYCKKENSELFVEVKGTTSNGRKQIIITRGEREHNQKYKGKHALIYVSGITLRGEARDEASGGVIEVVNPWEIREEGLRVISYDYKW